MGSESLTQTNGLARTVTVLTREKSRSARLVSNTIHHHGFCRFKSSSAKPWQKGNNIKSKLRQMSKQLKFLMKRETKRNNDPSTPDIYMRAGHN